MGKSWRERFVEDMHADPLGHGTLAMLACGVLAVGLVALIGWGGGLLALPVFAWLLLRPRRQRPYKPDEQTRRWYRDVTGHDLIE